MRFPFFVMHTNLKRNPVETIVLAPWPQSKLKGTEGGE